MKNWKLYIWRVLEGIGIIAAIVGLVLQYQSLQEQKILGAWQLITTKAEGNSGKIQALEFLNSKGVPLVGVDLSNAYLRGVNLKGANFEGANFTGASLIRAHFEGTHFEGANFTGADLYNADFIGAHFNGAWWDDGDFMCANCNDANFTGANLGGANFAGAFLGDANFDDADLDDANFTGANLSGANFTGADLSGATFFDTSDLETARLDGAFVSKYSPTLPTAPEGYEFVVSKAPSKDGKIFIELIKTKNLTT